MNQHQKFVLASTESKAQEFARMHDEQVDTALMRGQDEKADVHRTAALFLRTAVPKLVKTVEEQYNQIGMVTTELQRQRDEFETRGKRMESARAELATMIETTKSEIEYLRRGKGESTAAIKVLEAHHDKLAQMRDALKLK